MKVQYNNRLSRLLFNRVFRDQWVLPLPEGGGLRRFMRWCERHLPDPDRTTVPIDRPVFIISMPRSGSSMLQDVLAAHRDTAYFTQMMHLFWPEFRGAEQFRRKLSLNVEGERFIGDSVQVSGGSPSDPLQVWADWLGLDMYSNAYRRITIDDLPPGAPERIRNDIQDCLWCFRPDGKRFLSKNPGLMPYLPAVTALFPDARFIYLVRDPRQNANSMVKLYRKTEGQRQKIQARHNRYPQPLVPFPRLERLTEYLEAYGPESIETTARLWRDSVALMQAYEGRDDFITVRYEDVLTDKQKQISRLLEFCDLPREGAENERFQALMGAIGCVRHRNDAYDQFDRIETLCLEGMKKFAYL